VSVVVVVGNPNPGGRTTRAGSAVGSAIATARGEEAEIIELATLAPVLFEWGHPGVAEQTAKVASADVIVAASPTFKATYSGLLKAFFDNYGNDGLAGCRAVPVMLGAAPHHALAPEVHLRPLLVELGASLPCRGLYVLESQIDELDDVVAAWAVKAVPLLS
jgi:FMN reductase